MLLNYYTTITLVNQHAHETRVGPQVSSYRVRTAGACTRHTRAWHGARASEEGGHWARRPSAPHKTPPETRGSGTESAPVCLWRYYFTTALLYHLYYLY